MQTQRVPRVDSCDVLGRDVTPIRVAPRVTYWVVTSRQYAALVRPAPEWGRSAASTAVICGRQPPRQAGGRRGAGRGQAGGRQGHPTRGGGPPCLQECQRNRCTRWGPIPTALSRWHNSSVSVCAARSGKGAKGREKGTDTAVK